MLPWDFWTGRSHRLGPLLEPLLTASGSWDWTSLNLQGTCHHSHEKKCAKQGTWRLVSWGREELERKGLVELSLGWDGMGASRTMGEERKGEEGRRGEKNREEGRGEGRRGWDMDAFLPLLVFLVISLSDHLSFLTQVASPQWPNALHFPSVTWEYEGHQPVLLRRRGKIRLSHGQRNGSVFSI